MKIFSTILFLLLLHAAFAQQDLELFKNDAKGRPLYLTVNFATEGSPYFAEDYQPAQLTIMGGAVYNNVKVKLNLLDHLVQYLQPDGREMITEMPVQKIKFLNSGNIILQSFGGPLNMAGADIYQVLDTGHIQLLKKITIAFRDSQNYNEASTTRIFEHKESYYSLTGSGELKKLEKGRGAILELFRLKKDAVASFIDQGHLNCKSEADYKALFSFYNSSL